MRPMFLRLCAGFSADMGALPPPPWGGSPEVFGQRRSGRAAALYGHVRLCLVCASSFVVAYFGAEQCMGRIVAVR